MDAPSPVESHLSTSIAVDLSSRCGISSRILEAYSRGLCSLSGQQLIIFPPACAFGFRKILP